MRSKRVGLHASLEFVLAHPKIGELHMAILVHDDILQLQVTVDDPVLVQVLNGEQDLGRIEPGPVFGEGAKIADVLEEFSPAQVIHHKIQPVFTLEGVMKLDNEGVLDLPQDSVLNPRPLHVL